MTVDSRVAIVTGASSGIGAATARALAKAGARVALVARRRDRLEQLARECPGARVIEADLQRAEAPREIVANTVDAFGRVDILVNNAGIMLLSAIAEARREDWRKMIDLNLIAVMELTQEALPHLRTSKGHVVTIASLAGRIANPGASGYAATKFGAVAFSESLRREVYKDHVRVTVIEPGIVKTELGDHITNDKAKAGLAQRLAEIEALEAEDVAAAVLYAVSQPARVNINEIVIRPTGQER
jgi:NADP-dependent 3-hydroxy acid dehydrogenase YdfG